MLLSAIREDDVAAFDRLRFPLEDLVSLEFECG